MDVGLVGARKIRSRTGSAPVASQQAVIWNGFRRRRGPRPLALVSIECDFSIEPQVDRGTAGKNRAARSGSQSSGALPARILVLRQGSAGPPALPFSLLSITMAARDKSRRRSISAGGQSPAAPPPPTITILPGASAAASPRGAWVGRAFLPDGKMRFAFVLDGSRLPADIQRRGTGGFAAAQIETGRDARTTDALAVDEALGKPDHDNGCQWASMAKNLRPPNATSNTSSSPNMAEQRRAGELGRAAIPRERSGTGGVRLADRPIAFLRCVTLDENPPFTRSVSERRRASLPGIGILWLAVDDPDRGWRTLPWFEFASRATSHIPAPNSSNLRFDAEVMGPVMRNVWD